MAKSKNMEIVKGVSANQHIEIHSIHYGGASNNRHATVQFARWGSKASYDAGEKPQRLYAPMNLRGRSLKVFKRQRDMSGAAWAMLDMMLADQVPANMADSMELGDRGMRAELSGSSVVLDEGEQPFTLDMSE